MTKGAVRLKPKASSVNRAVIVLVVVVLLIAFVLFIAGVVLLHNKSCEESPKTSALTYQHHDPKCQFSEEAIRVGLMSFLDKVKKYYYEYNRDKIVYHPDLKGEKLREAKLSRYSPYNPDPKHLKLKTDISLHLFNEIMNKQINEDKLKPRESKALAQVKHYLQNNFGVPYDENYYGGDWMMGPNYFCWQPICDVPYSINSFAYKLYPKTFEDVQRIYNILRSHKKTFERYRKNMELGVLTGMVRAVEDCQSGLDAFKEKYKQIALSGNSSGVLNEWWTARYQAPDFLRSLNQDVEPRWKALTGKTIKQSLDKALEEGIGKPVLDLIQYLEIEHSSHCLPNNVSSGLANLPVDYVYTNLVPNKTRRTTKRLPTGQSLSGKTTYKNILQYFTTYNITPEEINEKGQELVDVFSPKTIEIAQNVTGISDFTHAVLLFVQILNLDDQWHNPEPFPENESNAQAHKICSSPEGAKTYCPKRWEALQIWSKYIHSVMGEIFPKLRPYFYFSGDKITAANCPIGIKPHFNPSQGTMFFQPSDSKCSRPSYFLIPFFLKEYGPKYQEWSVIGHESRPGHHTQMQGLKEHFIDKCGGTPQWLDKNTYYIAFREGWALYAENPILSDDVKLYKDNIFQLYGMYKWQIWRAVRLIVDTGLHYRGMQRSKAVETFFESTWDDSDFLAKEITRYMSIPGQATAYMLGRLAIIKMRQKAEKELGKLFDIREFHYQLLSQGSSPLGYLHGHIDRYIRCVKKELKGEICDLILLKTKNNENEKSQLDEKYQDENVEKFYI